MTAPTWLNGVISEFGRAAGVAGLALNASGAVAFRFSNGFALRFEYTGEELVVAVTFNMPYGTAATRRLLSFADPRAAGPVRLRSGIIAKTGAGVVAARIPERDVTLPLVNATFAALWRAAEEIGGAQ